MKDLSIDIETYSEVDLGKSGLYKYCLDPSFDILLFAYSIDFGPVEVVDLTSGDKIPDEVIKAMADDEVIKHAYNAAFEYNCLKAYGLDVGGRIAWHCTMFHAMYLGYPAGLAATGEAIGLPEEKQKLRTGKALIRYFCLPCKPTKVNGGRTRNLPSHDREKWDLFIEYCRQDVVTEMEIYKRLEAIPVPRQEQVIWAISDEANAAGVEVDFDLVKGAIAINDLLTEEQVERAKEISGLDNPNSVAQILPWLQKYFPEIDNVRKATVADLLARDDLPDEVREFLELRQELSKTSLKKYDSMIDCACEDHRMRGLLQCYGANRTGRWAGRLVQVQNLPRNYIENLSLARDLVKARDKELLEMLFGNVTDTISQLIRTAFVPCDGKKFIISDYSAIEARVIAWLAGEEWVNEVFASHGKIYEATASQMFGVPIEKIKKGNPEYALRQKGKVATLALGYQGGVGALKAMGADKMGLDDEELEDIKNRWRQANKNIVQFWYDLENAAVSVVETGEPRRVKCLDLSLEIDPIYGLSYLAIKLPSGRSLYYPEPHLKENQFGKYAVHFMGIGVNRKFSEESTYGGKLTENCVQAIARDCLAHALLNLYKDYPFEQVVMHIHDEVVMEADKEYTIDEINEVLSRDIKWAPGLILRGAGFESDYYMKD
ncbi:MAG: DNA polymerase [Peptoniphilaceae bacterium]|nr:DNA polymerase [Peptoniphilaceae bacterium]